MNACFSFFFFLRTKISQRLSALLIVEGSQVPGSCERVAVLNNICISMSKQYNTSFTKVDMTVVRTELNQLLTGEQNGHPSRSKPKQILCSKCSTGYFYVANSYPRLSTMLVVQKNQTNRNSSKNDGEQHQDTISENLHGSLHTRCSFARSNVNVHAASHCQNYAGCKVCRIRCKKYHTTKTNR